MSRLLLALCLLQAGPQGTGVVTGIVRSSSGSPSAGVRVYAITYRDAVEAAKSPPALDSLTVTDASGKYRLEIPPGRYHIASGSVAAPTYYPDTTDISAARIITVAANGIVSGIDFGTFVPANRAPAGLSLSLLPLVPPGNGVLSGVLRYADGKPASGVHVVAIPVSAMTQGNAGFTVVSNGTLNSAVIGQLILRSSNSLGLSLVSDSAGGFRIENLGPETYYIAAGFADAPIFYPGTTDVAKARTVTVTSNSRIDALDFMVPPSSPGATISGKVLTSAGAPASGAGVRIQNRDTPTLVVAALGLPMRNPPKDMIVGPDGLFTFNDVSPGNFNVAAMYSGVQSQIQNIVVSGQPINSLQFVLPIALITGRLLMEDGSSVANPKIFADVIVTTVNNPNIVASTILPITADGTFTRLHESGEYRFYLRVLPEEYEIKSMRFGAADLMQETLKITGKEPIKVDIRVAARSSPPVSSEVRVSGTAIDSVSGLPSPGERVTLCCRDSGPVERFSAPMKADGSFEFARIPTGKYEPAIQPAAGRPAIYTVGSVVDIGSQGLNGLVLSTTPQFGQVTATIMGNGSVPLPESLRPSIVFTGPMGRVRVIAGRDTNGIYMASVPIGGRYEVSVENLPEAFAVKSISGDATPTTVSSTSIAANPQSVFIVIERK